MRRSVDVPDVPLLCCCPLGLTYLCRWACLWEASPHCLCEGPAALAKVTDSSHLSKKFHTGGGVSNQPDRAIDVLPPPRPAEANAPPGAAFGNAAREGCLSARGIAIPAATGNARCNRDLYLVGQFVRRECPLVPAPEPSSLGGTKMGKIHLRLQSWHSGGMLLQILKTTAQHFNRIVPKFD